FSSQPDGRPIEDILLSGQAISWDQCLDETFSVSTALPLSLAQGSGSPQLSLSNFIHDRVVDFNPARSESSAWDLHPPTSSLPVDFNDFSFGTGGGVAPLVSQSSSSSIASSSIPATQSFYTVPPAFRMTEAPTSTPNTTTRAPEQPTSLASNKSSPSLSSSAPSPHVKDSASRIEKRKQNTLAARRYRQKRVDQMTSLEVALKETQSERDELKVKVARLEGEVETLRRLLSQK
ncbi:hypothetical protein M011DRAFT_466403, partial [Sporormia fimetaria CBS 119925]